MVVIKELFLENRFPSGWKLVPLIIYLPIGLVLATIRLFIGVQAIVAAALLHKLSTFRSAVLRTMCAILGVIVVQENEEVRNESVKVIVSNHVSLFDHLAIHLVTGSISVSVWELPAYFHFAFNFKDLGTFRDKENLVQNLKNYINSDVTVDIQAEGAITSGKKGLLRFSSWPCSLSNQIQPVSIKIWRPPLMDVSPSVISASWSSDFFWFLFVPFSVFTIKYLPVMQIKENETPEEMSKRVEKSIANDLNISVTNFTASDKLEYEKRLATEAAAASRPRPQPQSDALDMANRIKEVLPNVPLKVICNELARTKSFDATVANLLEGLVQYTPETNPPPIQPSEKPVPEKRPSFLNGTEPSTSKSASASSPVSFDTSAKTFPKSAQDRMLSFQERKKRLIESARQRYIEKHALNIINSS